MLQEIEVQVFGQVLEPKKKVNLASDTVNEVGLLFDFDEKWQEFNLIHAYFRNCGSGYSAPPELVDEENKVKVPWKILTTTGKIDVHLVANKVDEDGFVTERLTSYKTTVYVVKENVAVENKIGPTGGEFEYLVTMLNKKQDKKPYDSLIRRSKFLYDIEFSDDNLDYEYARDYMKNKYKELEIVGCSAVYKNGLLAKNYDWYYDWCVEFATIVKPSRGRYASIGVAGGLKALTVESVQSGENLEAYKLVPFIINEGCNECGVFVAANVVPDNETKNGVQFTTRTTGTHPELEGADLCTLMLARVVLDNYSNATDACIALRDNYNIYCPHGEGLDEEMHFMIGDIAHQYVVEFINNNTIITEVTDQFPWITNYYRTGANLNTDGTLDWMSLTDHPMGVHRNDLIAYAYPSLSSVHDMMTLIQDTLRYTKTYETFDWRDEFCGVTDTFGNLTIEDAMLHPDRFNDIFSYARGLYLGRSREEESPYYGTWETCHSVVYDIESHKMWVIVKEEGMTKAHYYSYDKDNEIFVGFEKANKLLKADENGMISVVD